MTTKKAKEGPITLSYTGELSTEQVSRRPQVLDRDAFVRFGVGTDLGASTDWYGELLNEGALSQRHVVNLSGGGHTAIEWYTKAAELGYARAICYLGECYYYGTGSKRYRNW